MAVVLPVHPVLLALTIWLNMSKAETSDLERGGGPAGLDLSLPSRWRVVLRSCVEGCEGRPGRPLCVVLATDENASLAMGWEAWVRSCEVHLEHTARDGSMAPMMMQVSSVYAPAPRVVRPTKKKPRGTRDAVDRDVECCYQGQLLVNLRD